MCMYACTLEHKFKDGISKHILKDGIGKHHGVTMLPWEIILGVIQFPHLDQAGLNPNSTHSLPQFLRVSRRCGIVLLPFQHVGAPSLLGQEGAHPPSS